MYTWKSVVRFVKPFPSSYLIKQLIHLGTLIRFTFVDISSGVFFSFFAVTDTHVFLLLLYSILEIRRGWVFIFRPFNYRKIIEIIHFLAKIKGRIITTYVELKNLIGHNIWIFEIIKIVENRSVPKLL